MNDYDKLPEVMISAEAIAEREADEGTRESRLGVHADHDVDRIAHADGMRDGRILIPSDDIAFEIISRRAADPDAFTRSKIASFASGDVGMPKMP